MTLTELIKAARTRADDLVAPYLWSNAEWTEYANEAEREACRRARLILDSTTAEVCNLTMVANTPTYALDKRIIHIRRVKGSWSSIPLQPASVIDLDRGRPGWEDETGDPQHFIKDMDHKLFRPYPTPSAAGTVKLTVHRIPLVNMEDGDDEPEILEAYHLGLVHWMLHRAYNKHDTQTYNPKASAEALALFEAEFGKRSSAQEESWIRQQHGYTPDEGVY
jgi:hypothetical protein